MRHPFADVAAGDLFRQRQVVLIMARFGSQQRDVKAVQLVVGCGASLAKRSQDRASM